MAKKNHDENWSLFRLSDRKQFDNVSLETIDFFFRAISSKRHVEWLMWREGFSGWRPFSELPLILKHLQADGGPVATPPPVPESILKYADEITGVRHVTATVGSQIVRSVDTSDEVEIDDVRTTEEDDDEPLPQDFSALSKSAPAPVEAKEPVDERVQRTHSSVSVRAIHAATSSLRHKSGPAKPAAPPIEPSAPTGDVPFELEAVKPFEIAIAAEAARQAAPGKPEVVADRSARADLADHARVIPMGDEATLSLMLESQAANEDRNNVRYQKRFKVRIFTPKGVVSTVTTDCSTSGFRLKEPLPTGLPRFFHVELDLGPEGKIPLVCSEIREKDGRAPTRVRIQVNDHMNILKSALMRAA